MAKLSGPASCPPEGYALVELEKKKVTSISGCYKGQVDVSLTWKPREAELREEWADLTAELWSSNRPVPHRFALRMMAPAALRVPSRAAP